MNGQGDMRHFPGHSFGKNGITHLPCQSPPGKPTHSFEIHPILIDASAERLNLFQPLSKPSDRHYAN